MQVKDVQAPDFFPRDGISSLVQDWMCFVSPLLTKALHLEVILSIHHEVLNSHTGSQVLSPNRKVMNHTFKWK